MQTVINCGRSIRVSATNERTNETETVFYLVDNHASYINRLSWVTNGIRAAAAAAEQKEEDLP